MNKAVQSWFSNAENAILSSLASQGFRDLSSFLPTIPSRPYREVADKVGGVAPVHIIIRQFKEARAAGTIRDAAMDGLCRNLCETLPEGWGVGEKSDWRAIKALSSWETEVEVTGSCPELEPIVVKISEALHGLPPPTGWIPEGTTDPIVKSVFDAHWPTECK